MNDPKDPIERLTNLLDNANSNLGYAKSALDKAQEELEALKTETTKEEPAVTRMFKNDVRLLKEWVNIADSFVNICICERCQHLYADGYVMGDCDCEDRVEGETVYGSDLIGVLD